MILFKAIKNQHLDGWKDIRLSGSFKYGARWNLPGVPAMYTSKGIQNTMLEAANYNATPEILNKLFTIVVFEVPELRLRLIDFEELPAKWANIEHAEEVKKVGSDYLQSNKYDGIIVPSATLNSKLAMHETNAIRDCAYQNVIINLPTVKPESMKIVGKFSPIYSPNAFRSHD